MVESSRVHHDLGRGRSTLGQATVRAAECKARWLRIRIGALEQETLRVGRLEERLWSWEMVDEARRCQQEGARLEVEIAVLEAELSRLAGEESAGSGPFSGSEPPPWLVEMLVLVREIRDRVVEITDASVVQSLLSLGEWDTLVQAVVARVRSQEVLTVTEAAKVLRRSPAAARRFLERHDLVVMVEGRARIARCALFDVLRRARSSRDRAGAAESEPSGGPLFVMALD